jgi:DsbC/DsbD-like thiol-disulfide interchange protein
MANWYLIFFLGILSSNNQIVTDSIVQITVPEVHVHPGEIGVIDLHVTIKEGYHIQAHVVYDEFLVPTTIELADGEAVSALSMKFPPGRKFRLEGSSDYLYVYDESFAITISFKVNKKVRPGKYSVKGKLDYQACDMKTCLRPRTANFAIPLTIL